MSRSPDFDPRPVVIVLGCDEIGGAVAPELHGGGHAIVVIDDIDPGGRAVACAEPERARRVCAPGTISVRPDRRRLDRRPTQRSSA